MPTNKSARMMMLPVPLGNHSCFLRRHASSVRKFKFPAKTAEFEIKEFCKFSIQHNLSGV